MDFAPKFRNFTFTTICKPCKQKLHCTTTPYKMKELRELYYTLIGERWKIIPEYLSYHKSTYGIPSRSAVVIDMDGCILPDPTSGLKRDPFPNVIETLHSINVDSNISIFIITARPEEDRLHTLHELRRAGVLRYVSHVYCLPDMMNVKTNEMLFNHIEQFKRASRDLIRKNGFQIILAVGDQKGDLTFDDKLGNKDACLNILLENPF